MHMADGPVGIVRERIDGADRHEGALEGGQAVENGGHHHEAQRGVVAHLVPGAVERGERVAGGRPGRHQQHQRKGHAERLNPLRQRRIVQVVRARPHIHEGDAPEADDRQPIREDRPAGPLRQVVVEHPEEAGGEEEGHGIVAVPPLRHRILHAGKQRIALGVAERHRNGEVVDDVQHRHDQDERHVVPVGDVDVRFLPPCQRADVDQEIGDPDDHQQDVGIPFRLGIFLGLGEAHQVAARGQHAKQVVADEHEPGAELVGQACARRALQDMEGRGDQRVAAEAEDDAGRVDGPQAPEARPCRVEGQVRPCEQRGDPHADGHGDHGPDHRKHNAGLGRIIVIAGKLFRGGLRREQRRQHCEKETRARHHDDEPVHAHGIGAPGYGHGKPGKRDKNEDDDCEVAFAEGELRDHINHPVLG